MPTENKDLKAYSDGYTSARRRLYDQILGAFYGADSQDDFEEKLTNIGKEISASEERTKENYKEFKSDVN